MSEPKVAKEVAEEDLNRWIQAMGLRRKLDDARLDEESRAAMREAKLIVIDAIMEGALHVDESNQFVFTPQHSDDQSPMTFGRLKAGTLIGTDKYGPNASMRKMQSVIAEMTGQNPPRFARMEIPDWEVCTSIFALFLG